MGKYFPVELFKISLNSKAKNLFNLINTLSINHAFGGIHFITS